MLVKPNARTYHVHLASTVADGSIQIKTTSKGAFTVTIASPAVFTLTGHGLVAEDAVYFSTTGALPIGLTAGTLYYVISTNLTVNTFSVSAVKGGQAVNTSGTQSGVHTVFTPYRVDYETYALRLVPTRNGLHPIIQFMHFNVIGNGNNLSVWETLTENPLNTEYLRHKLVFPSGYEVCGLAYSDEFVAIACEKRSSNNNADFQDGKIFFWDGMTGTYTFFIDVPEGAPYSPFYYKGVLYYIARGEWFAYVDDTLSRLRRFPNVEQEFTSERDFIRIYPNMTAVRKGILLQGFPSDTANTTLEYGVYSLGSRDKDYPNAFSYDFQISTGTRLNTAGTLRTGMIKNFNEDLFISWRDGSTYGVDRVYNNSLPAATASLESLIFDNGNPWDEKLALGLKAIFLPLPTGATVRLKYKIDRGSWVYSDTVTTGATSILHKINSGRFFEIEFGLDITTASASATPKIIAIAFNYDDLQEEKDFS